MAGYTAKVKIEELSFPPDPLKALAAFKKYPYSFFLDSACDHTKLGRFSFLGCDPFLVFKSKSNDISLEWQGGRKEKFKKDPFSALKDIFSRYEICEEDTGIPFLSGGVGYFAYDLKDFLEELPDISKDDMGLPDCILGFYDTVLIYDNLFNKAYIASSGFPCTEASENMARRDKRLEKFRNVIYSDGFSEGNLSCIKSELRSNFSKTSYIEAVKKAKEYIAKGDIYQVNLSQRFEADLMMGRMELYSRLRSLSPAPFSSYLDFNDAAILSSSPERFLLKRGRYIETRPIKGTRPRGKNAAEDLFFEKELLNSPKDMAEHIMIVDLERNDLGRICEYGSIAPTEYIILEKYANVFHLVSTVSGRLKKSVGPVDCLSAVFPGGSITGAPKIRAMEIVEELEPVKRSVYTGAIGYISFNGNMDTSIVIRTFVAKGNKVYFQVGGGIVADSDPLQEYEETLHKAAGLIDSLNIDKREAVAV